MTKVYYNEFDPHVAAWLRELIKAGHLPPGEVDERSIEDVRPNELRGYAQCHFFAGIGGWAHALDIAGWPRDRPVWTGSCPCQPFSSAGSGAGFDDKRHLWPAWFHLIRECRPAAIFGEQVASKAAEPWLDLVQADMEAMDYAFGAVAFPAAGVGAPHIRDRTYWVADAASGGRTEEREITGRSPVGNTAQRVSTGLVHGFTDCGLAHSDGWNTSTEREQRGGEQRQQPQDVGACRLADSGSGRIWNVRCEKAGGSSSEVQGKVWEQRVWADSPPGGTTVPFEEYAPSPLHGQWRDADWLLCRDGRWRPVEPGTFPLAHGIPARVVRLRGYGNAIVPQQAAEFITAFAEESQKHVAEAA